MVMYYIAGSDANIFELERALVHAANLVNETGNPQKLYMITEDGEHRLLYVISPQ